MDQSSHRAQKPQVHQLARIFGPLHLAIAALEKFYSQVSEAQDIPPLVLNELHPCLFPHPMRFKEYRAGAGVEPEWTEFEHCGGEAYEILAGDGMALWLLYYGPLDGKSDARNVGSGAQGNITSSGLYVGPTLIVVMEHIKGRTVDETPVLPQDTCKRTEEAIKKLHDAQLAFGDLRAPKLMLSGGDVFPTGFDWAGRVGEARYSLYLSRSAK